MLKGKYVMTARGPIIFSEMMQHDRFKDFNPTSAGFVRFNDDGTVTTYGESVSLKLHPCESDHLMILASLSIFE